eukprot:m.30071 g.30071  ORF g.30071 m.30071 type:complete len:74 (-) comp10522_c0_seq2:1618-1839(-)
MLDALTTSSTLKQTCQKLLGGNTRMQMCRVCSGRTWTSCLLRWREPSPAAHCRGNERRDPCDGSAVHTGGCGS